MTKKKLTKVCSNNNYIVLRYKHNGVSALNCKVAALSCFNNVKNDNTETKYVGYYRCSFMEYIQLKVPFIATKPKQRR